MNKPAFIVKSLCLSAALSFPLAVQSKQDSSFDGLLTWVFYRVVSSIGFSQATNEMSEEHEKELMERFSQLEQGGLPEDPELMDKLFSHMYYTEDLEARNNPFVHHLLAYYAPGSAAYEASTLLAQDFIKHMAVIEDTYRNPADYEDEDEGYPPLSEIMLMLAEEDAREARS